MSWTRKKQTPRALMKAGVDRDAHQSVIAYVGLGSNLDHPVCQVTRALTELDRMRATRCLVHSSLYASRPVGPAEQPDFINAVARLKTQLSPEQLLDCLQALEQAHGRRRNGVRWGPRPLDLDLLLYADLALQSPRLSLPHPELHKRAFVLYPLLEVAPAELDIPGLGQLAELVSVCPTDGIERLKEGISFAD